MLRVSLTRMLDLEHEEHLAIFLRCEVEVIHGLVPNRDLRARDIPGNSSVVRFAFNQDGRIFAAKVKTMQLL